MKIAEFDIEVERKAIKNVHLAVYPPDAKVHISVPESMKDDDVSMFLYSKLSWIRGYYEQVKGQERQSNREYVTGENHYLLGNRLLLKVCPTREKAHVTTTASYMELHINGNATTDRRRSVVYDFYRAELNAVLERMVAKWAEAMGENLSTFKWSILHMDAAWGKCSTQKRSINFNLLLARVPMRCIEYIVVHEMIHLKVHGHDKVFAMYLNKHLPDWQLRKKELDEFVALPLREEKSCNR